MTLGISITQAPAGFVFHGVGVSTEFECINKPAKVDTYPLPRVEALFAALARGQYFSKLDMSQAYLQVRTYVQLDEHSRELVTIHVYSNTPDYPLVFLLHQQYSKSAWKIFFKGSREYQFI